MKFTTIPSDEELLELAESHVENKYAAVGTTSCFYEYGDDPTDELTDPKTCSVITELIIIESKIERDDDNEYCVTVSCEVTWEDTETSEIERHNQEVYVTIQNLEGNLSVVRVEE